MCLVKSARHRPRYRHDAACQDRPVDPVGRFLEGALGKANELHLDYPFAGARMLRDLLAGEGIRVGRPHVSTLMKRMGIAALYRNPNTSKPAPGYKAYPYLLRRLPVTAAQPGLGHGDITYIPMARGSIYLAAV